MTGVVMGAAAGGASIGFSGAPTNTFAWGNINAVSGGATGAVTLTGVTGAMSVSATNSGPGQLMYTLNSVNAPYAGPFAWPEGQTLIWSVIGAGSGTVIVTNESAGGTLDTFTYVIVPPSRSSGFQP
jgi:hypothetical protein